MRKIYSLINTDGRGRIKKKQFSPGTAMFTRIEMVLTRKGKLLNFFLNLHLTKHGAIQKAILEHTLKLMNGTALCELFRRLAQRIQLKGNGLGQWQTFNLPRDSSGQIVATMKAKVEECSQHPP